MKDLLEKKNVELCSTENEEKSSVVERWHRTIKRNVEIHYRKQYNEPHRLTTFFFIIYLCIFIQGR